MTSMKGTQVEQLTFLTTRSLTVTMENARQAPHYSDVLRLSQLLQLANY